ncbi:MAG: S8 family serine peptidase [Candidatus Heimdallarchaeota archaeon]|nr:MAG: S8 family serine peptidase [Candidatus Heimdallarchaeota archaeon]
MKKKLISTVLVIVMTLTILPLTGVYASTAPIPSRASSIAFSANPVKIECWGGYGGSEIPEGTVPFNIDMIDAEDLSNDGEGIYVAVLDTGLLSNYLNFFPEGQVNVKEEWGLGFSHEVFYDPDGEGNWSIEAGYKFSYKELNAERGFYTFDEDNPLWSYYPPLGMWFPFPYGNGHGTHVSSIITGYQFERDDVAFWVRGVAPKITLIPVLVLDDWIVFADDGNGWWWSGGTNEMVAAGIEYIGWLAEEHDVKIIVNLSLGGPSPSELIEEAVNYAISQGVIIVASAGNEGYDGMGWPGAYPQVISCASAGWTGEYLRYYTGDLDPYYWFTDDVPECLWTEDVLGNDFQVYLSDFSSRPNPDLGQKPWHLDVAAPGAAIKGPYRPEGDPSWYDMTDTRGIWTVWGTSQAAPHVSGIAAMVLEKYPKANQFTMEMCLKAAGFYNRMTKWRENERTATIFDILDTFDLIDQTWFRNDYGTGLLQADSALFVAKFMFRRCHRGRHGGRKY